MNIEAVLKMIEGGEGLNTEFKESRNALSRDLYETICAFLNRNGGHILLGVNDAGEIKGVNPNSLVKIKKEIITTVNNP